MSKLSFKIDKKQISVGEYVTVSWDCVNPDMVTLIVQDGGKSVYQLGDSGSRVIQASGSADKMLLTLRASIGGKAEEKSVEVKVKKKVLKAERIPRNPKIKDWWQRTTVGMKTAWTYMPGTKKLAVKIMGLLLVTMILTSISPKLLPLGLFIVVIYLGWYVMKRT